MPSRGTISNPTPIPPYTPLTDVDDPLSLDVIRRDVRVLAAMPPRRF